MSYKTDKFDDQLVGLLNDGAVGFLPSDTIYGLSCRALDAEAVAKVHRLKRRDKHKPFVILISDTSQLKQLGIVSTDAAPALRYWPGALTIICDAAKAPEWLHMGTHSLAVRQPDYEELRQLIDQTGPLISTSVNLAGQTPAQDVNSAQKYFGDKLDYYVNVGKLKGQPSTIVKSNFGELKVIRPGAVKIKSAGDK